VKAQPPASLAEAARDKVRGQAKNALALIEGFMDDPGGE